MIVSASLASPLPFNVRIARPKSPIELMSGTFAGYSIIERRQTLNRWRQDLGTGSEVSTTPGRRVIANCLKKFLSPLWSTVKCFKPPNRNKKNVHPPRSKNKYQVHNIKYTTVHLFLIEETNSVKPKDTSTTVTTFVES